MFITDVTAHHPFMSNLAGKGKDAWKVVTLSMPKEWFYVSYSVTTPSGEHTETALITHPAGELISVLASESEGVSVAGVQLVSPPYLNRSKRWKMEPLVRLWKKPSDPLASVYEVEGGKRYCTAYGKWDISEYEFCREFPLTC